MRGKTTLENVMAKVHEMSLNNWDDSIAIEDMEFESLDWLLIGNNVYEVRPSAQRLIANKLRIPLQYLSRCPSDLQAVNLNHWLREEERKRDSFFCRFNSHAVRGVFTERYTVLDHTEILSKMVEQDFPTSAEVHVSLDETLMVLKVPEYSRTFVLNGENDKVVPGISLANSEVGVWSFSISAYFYRLVCSNGLIAKTAVTSKFKHISRKALDEFPLVLGQVIHESQYGERRFLLSMETPVENPVNTMASFNRQFQLTQKQEKAVEQAWQIEQGNTMFHVMNAYTRAAQDSLLTAEESYHLERVGGQILALVRP
jgi:hypothetical protein